jgi:hypothetical protein
MTSGTYGRPGTGSFRSNDLRLSLESKLRTVTDSLGSTLFQLTWKTAVTPSGRSISRLAASVRRTSGNDCFSWPTPTVSRGDYQISRGEKMLKLSGAAKLATWPTPCQQDGPKGGPNQGADRLPGAASLAIWATPMASEREQTPKKYIRGNPNLAMMASWATPAAREAGGTPEAFLSRKEKAKSKGAKLGIALTSLSLQAQLTKSPAPSTENGGGASWIYCKDGKYRPIEPGSFPLAHGAPARVGRLRGYGNAINAEAAAAFIRAYREVRR